MNANEIKGLAGGPGVKNPSCNTGDTGSIFGQETNIPHIVKHLSPCATAPEPVSHN